MTGSVGIGSRLSVAVPASLVSDTPHLREKTGKIGLIARACSVFGVREVILYADDASRDQSEDLKFCELILRFVETPQYLRKRIFRLSPSLRFTGILPPLQTPHHDVARRLSDSKVGDTREGVITHKRGEELEVDAGLERPIICRGDLPPGTRVTVRLSELARNPIGEIVDQSKISIYWGYRVRQPKFRLGSLLKQEKFDLTIGASRYGEPLSDVWSGISDSLKNSDSVLVAFGSPRMGLREILRQEAMKPEDVFNFVVNTVPDQNVSTVRTEEAVLITLGVFNAMRVR